MNMTDKDRRAIRTGAIVLLCLAVAQFALLPWLRHWGAARDRIDSARVELAELELQVQRVTGQRGKLNDALGPAVAKPLINVEKAQISAFKSAQQTLQMGGVQVKSVRPQPARPLRELPGIALASLQIEGQGMFMQMPQAFASLRNAEQLLLVEKLSLTGSPQMPGMLNLTLVLATPALEEIRK